MTVKVVGLDIAKSVFQVHGVNEAGAETKAATRGRLAMVRRDRFCNHRYRRVPDGALLGSRTRGPWGMMCG